MTSHEFSDLMREKIAKAIEGGLLIDSCLSARCFCLRHRCKKHKVEHCGLTDCNICAIHGNSEDYEQVLNRTKGTCESGKCSHKRTKCPRHDVNHCTSIKCFVCLLKPTQVKGTKPVSKPESKPESNPMKHETCATGCTCIKTLCIEHNTKHCYLIPCRTCFAVTTRDCCVTTCPKAVCDCVRKVCMKHRVTYCGNIGNCIFCESAPKSSSSPIHAITTPPSRHVVWRPGPD